MKHHHAVAYIVLAVVIAWLWLNAYQGGAAYATTASYAATT